MFGDYKIGYKCSNNYELIDTILEKNHSNILEGNMTIQHNVNKKSDVEEYETSLIINEEDIYKGELIVYSKTLLELQEYFQDKDLRLIINSENINDGTSGLIKLTEDGLNSVELEPPLVSRMFTVIGSSNKDKFVLFGFKTPIKNKTFFKIEDGLFKCGCFIENHFKKDDRFISDKLLILTGDSPYELMEQYGDICVLETPGRNSASLGIGWNSWDYYAKYFTHDDLLENLTHLKTLKENENLNITFAALDDGWFDYFGDWNVNDRFPRGMQKVAEDINSYGFIPGIWTAPFFVVRESQFFKNNEDACVRKYDEDTKKLTTLFVGDYAILDPTHPKGEELITKLYKKLVKWGFKYFKVDFIHHIVSADCVKVFYKDSMERLEIVRHALKLIRKTIGEEAYLVTCGCQPEASIGIADANRLGGDTGTWITTSRIQAQFMSVRYWMNKRFYNNDPDFLIIRDNDTSNDKDHNFWVALNGIVFDKYGSRTGNPWNGVNEPRIWATLVAMSGGELVLSDRMSKLNIKGIELIKKAIKHSNNDTAIALDLFDNLYPSIWYREGNERALAIINWEDKEKTVTFDGKHLSIIKEFIGLNDIWDKKTFSISGGVITLTIPPRDVIWFVKREESYCE